MPCTERLAATSNDRPSSPDARLCEIGARAKTNSASRLGRPIKLGAAEN